MWCSSAFIIDPTPADGESFEFGSRLFLQRVVETFQFVENKSTTTKDKLGGKQVTCFHELAALHSLAWCQLVSA